MSLIPWRSFSDMENFFDDDSWFLPMVSLNKKRKTAINLYETDKKLVAEADVAGFSADNIEISVKDGILEIKAKKEEDKEEKKKNYWKKEFYKSSFEKSVRLPVNVDEKKIDATIEDGILKIEMSKKEKKKSEKIKIKVKKKK